MAQLDSKHYPDNPIILLHTTPNTSTWNSIVHSTSPEENIIEALRSKGYTNLFSLPRRTQNDPVGTIIQ
jgi:hypothetical protein